MILDEAIKHAEELADYDCYNEKQLKCAEEYRQLAEWLKELKQLREQTRWIPVTERLPKEGGDYLVTLSLYVGGKEPAREIRKDFYCILSKKWLYNNDYVTAWMPLPQPYKAESEDKR